LQGPLEDAQRVRDGDAVVGYWRAGLSATDHASEDFATVPHARAAVDYELIAAKVLGKVVPGSILYVQLAPDVLP
jgi:hypothetical protein